MRLHSLFPRALLFAAALSAAALPAFADDLIANGGFETGDFTGWTVVDSSDNTFVSAAILTYLPYSGTYAALLGANTVAGTVSQTVTDTSGQAYELSFYLASDGGMPNLFEAGFDGTAIFSATDLAAQGYGLYSFIVFGTGSDTITFTEEDLPGFLSLDDVSLSTTSVAPTAPIAPTPEPSSFAMLGTGLLSAAALLRRRAARSL